MPKHRFNPLPAAAFQVLMSLADDDLHGYEIMRRLEEQNRRTNAHGSRNALQLDPGVARRRIQSLKSLHEANEM